MADQNESSHEDTRWWIATGDKPEGPHTRSYIEMLLRSGRIASTNLACPVDGDEWKPIREWPELSDLAAVPGSQSVPPPVPMPTVLPQPLYWMAAAFVVWLGRFVLVSWLGWEGVFAVLYWIVFVGSGGLVGVLLAAKWHSGDLKEREQLDYVAAIAGAVCGTSLWCLLGFWRGFLLLLSTGGAFLAYFVAREAKSKQPEEKPWLWWTGSGTTGLLTLVVLYFGVLRGPGHPGLPVKSISKASLVLNGSWTEMDLPASEPGLSWHGTAFAYERDGDSLKMYTNSHCLGLRSLAEHAIQQSNRTANIGHYRLMVTFPSGKKRQVLRIGETTDLERDIARIEVSAEGLVERKDYVVVPTVADCIDQLDVQPGDEVIALGTPFDPELAGTQTFGRVGALRVPKHDPQGAVFIQHDATMTDGSSGGPLFLKNGKTAHWIGINTLVVDSTSIGFAISADEVVETEYQWADADPGGAAELVLKQANGDG